MKHGPWNDPQGMCRHLFWVSSSQNKDSLTTHSTTPVNNPLYLWVYSPDNGCVLVPLLNPFWRTFFFIVDWTLDVIYRFSSSLFGPERLLNFILFKEPPSRIRPSTRHLFLFWIQIQSCPRTFSTLPQILEGIPDSVSYQNSSVLFTSLKVNSL